MESSASREWRSPRPPPRRALQSPVYIRKKAAAHKRGKEKRKNFKELKLKWRNRWNQLRIASSCPIAPSKKRFPKSWFHNQYTRFPKILVYLGKLTAGSNQ